MKDKDLMKKTSARRLGASKSKWQPPRTTERKQDRSCPNSRKGCP